MRYAQAQANLGVNVIGSDTLVTGADTITVRAGTRGALSLIVIFKDGHAYTIGPVGHPMGMTPVDFTHTITHTGRLTRMKVKFSHLNHHGTPSAHGETVGYIDSLSIDRSPTNNLWLDTGPGVNYGGWNFDPRTTPGVAYREVLYPWNGNWGMAMTGARGYVRASTYIQDGGWGAGGTNLYPPDGSVLEITARMPSNSLMQVKTKNVPGGVVFLGWGAGINNPKAFTLPIPNPLNKRLWIAEIQFRKNGISGAAAGDTVLYIDNVRIYKDWTLTELCALVKDAVDLVCDPDGVYGTHGKYVSCVAHAANDLIYDTLYDWLTEDLGLDADDLEELHSCVVSAAARSDIGK